MSDSGDDTLLDRWLQRLKNNRVLAVLLFVGVVVGALASFTDSLSSLAKLFQDQGSQTSAPVVNRFETRPEQIDPGGKATLDWSVAGADSVTIDGGIGSVPLRGSRDVSPTQTTTYALTARSGG